MKRRLTAALLLPGAAALLLVWGCPLVSPPTTECAAATEACTTTGDCCDGLECNGGTCGVPASGTQAAIPAKQIELNLIGIHDPDAESYNGNCVGCHGDRTDEVALDGVTPTAHATMADLFGEGNDRCIACHNGGPNFFDFAYGSGDASAGGLREQVDMEEENCGACHGANAAVALYAD